MSRKYPVNPRLEALTQSATFAINERCKALEAQGKTVYNLGLGQSPFPIPISVVGELRRNAHQKMYLPAQGLYELREAVAAFYGRTSALYAEPEQVMIGPGSKELLFLLQLSFHGDILIPTPSWVSYVPQARIIGRRVKFIHTRFEDRWRVTPELLEELMRKASPARNRLLILNYPDNPTGLTYTQNELEVLAEIARRYNIFILADEIYGQIHHEGTHASIAPLYPEGTIVSSGLSKWCGAGGWRLGTFVFPRELGNIQAAMQVIASETYSSVNAPTQYAAVAAFEGNEEIERYLAHVRRILQSLGNRGTQVFQDAGVRVHAPHGAFYLFLDFSPLKKILRARGITSGIELTEALFAETSVALLPGSAFSRSGSELTARLAYVNFKGAEALQASLEHALAPPALLPETFLLRRCAATVTAFNKIVQWLGN